MVQSLEAEDLFVLSKSCYREVKIVTKMDAADSSMESNGAIEFGWEDDRPLSGRRKKKERELKKKSKPGTFGLTNLFIHL